MSEELKEAAKALVEKVEKRDGGHSVLIPAQSGEYKALKAALRPSKEECIKWLKDGNDNYTFQEGHALADASIEYLREDK